MAVLRIYVEKKKEYAVEAQGLATDIRDFLQISGLATLRIVNRYDVEGIDRDLFEECRNTIFSEPQVDDTFDELPKEQHTIAVEYLPGQYDQRADSCAQCIQLISQQQRPRVRTARIYLLSGNLSPQDLQAIRNYVINPIESREASLEPFATLAENFETPADVAVLEGFGKMEDKDLGSFLSEYGLAMDQADLALCRDYFRSEDRDPTVTEIRMLDTYWSDHCRHTTFLTEIDSVSIADDRVKKAYRSYLGMRSALGRQDKPVTLMDMATIGAKYLKEMGALTNVDESEEVNACSVKIDVDVDGKVQPWLLMFKNETHNHPTEIEPFGGASTCLGGGIRDPLSGRSYVYQAMRITGAANPLTPVDQTLPGKLPQRKLVTTAAAGYSSYGNQIGLAGGIVREIYHPGYAAKRMEMGALVGAAPESYVVRETPKPCDGVILLGGKTGRDGCGAATGSSKSQNVSSLEESSSEVQKGNPPEERKILRLFRKEEVTRLMKRCNDFGAGGVSVAIGELADSLEIDLDAVPTKYEGLDGTELAISESQERMAVVVAPENIDLFIEYAKKENLEATVVARVTDTDRLTMYWRGKKIVDLSREFLNSNGAPKHINVEVPVLGEAVKDLGGEPFPTLTSLRPALEDLVGSLNFCSQKGLVDRFDSTAGAGTVLMPFGGTYQETAIQAMVAKLPVIKGDTTTCSAMSWGFNPYLTQVNPYQGSYLAVVESVAKLVACGGDLKNCWLSFQEFFEKLGEDPLRWGKPFSALLGALSAQKDLKIGAIGGKDSMSGSFEDLDVPPTLVSVAVCTCNAGNVISPEFKRAGNPILLIEPEYCSDGLPSKESLINGIRIVQQLIKERKVVSAYALTAEGCAGAIFEMSLGNRIGLEFSTGYNTSRLFDLKYGGFLVEWDNSADPLDSEVLDYKTTNLPVERIGTTCEDFHLKKSQEIINLSDLRKIYYSTLEPVFPTNVKDSQETASELPHAQWVQRSITKPSGHAGKPKVLIPVFPGTHCEYETANALERAGAVPEIRVIRNLTPEDVADSFKEIADQIRSSQILVIPGGASAGDEPGGSAKFITAFFRNPMIAEEVQRLLEQRDGLMLGIGNGFQALIKLGLVPFGQIRKATADSPTLTYNSIGRHQSGLVRTRIVSNRSPWFMDTEIGEIHTLPLSHGEGRFVADEALVRKLADNGQIATQYVDLSGSPSMDIRYNPNGSFMAIEAITSPDGRILGKMAHSERLGSFLYKNVPSNKEQKLFENAVRYYQY